MTSLTRSTASSRAKARGSSFSILEDNVPSSPASYRALSSPKSSPYRSHRQNTALKSITVDHAQNRDRKIDSHLRSLAAAESAQSAPVNNNNRQRRGSILRNNESRAPLARLPLESNTFVAPQKHARFDLPQEESDLDLPEQKCRIFKDLSENDPDRTVTLSGEVQEQLALNREGHFDLILTVPAGPSQENHFDSRTSQDSLESLEEKSYYGCNIVHEQINDLSADPESCYASGTTTTTYTLIAHPIPADEVYLTDEPNFNETDIMEESEDNHATTPTEQELQLPELPPDSGFAEKHRPSPLLKRQSSNYSSPAGPRSPGSFARVEDTFEVLDRLEEQFETIDSFMHVEHILSPEKMPSRAMGSTHQHAVNSSPSAAAQLKRAASVAGKASISRNGSLRANTGAEGLSRSRSLRKSTSMTLNSTTSPSPAPIPARTTSITRPASLLPPKPPAKSTKAPTVPAFTLPGEAVAMRLKEQREARQAAMLAAQAPPPPARNPARRPPTIPTFELPGEAISRRKREEHEARLRAEQEAERKRREFKARPIRASLAPSGAAQPRETVASRARAAALAAAGNADVGRRQSTAIGSGRPSSMISRTSSTSRGRERVTGDVPTLSRATSSSTGSTSGKRSTVTAEDAQLQKIRGKMVWERDNHVGVVDNKEREKREKAARADAARREAAERSRMKSREWAEKQRNKLKGMSGQGKGVAA